MQPGARHAGYISQPAAADSRSTEAWALCEVSRRLVIGTDGGVYASLDAGGTWIHQTDFAAGEYYRISVDDAHDALPIWVSPASGHPP